MMQKIASYTDYAVIIQILRLGIMTEHRGERDSHSMNDGGQAKLTGRGCGGMNPTAAGAGEANEPAGSKAAVAAPCGARAARGTGRPVSDILEWTTKASELPRALGTPMTG